MKTSVYGIGLMYINVIVIIIILTITGRTNRQSEVNNSLQISVEAAVADTLNNRTYTVNDSQELVSDILQSVEATIGTVNGSIQAKIDTVDKEKGIAFLTVTESYSNPNGKPGTVSYTKKVVMDQHEAHDDAADPLIHEASFYVDGKIYETAVLKKEFQISKIKDPVKKGKVFLGWSLDGRNVADLSNLTMDQDYTFYAVFG